MIELKKLVVGYQNKAVAAPITGIISSGSLTAIKGANGAGKSTLLKTLCGLQPAVNGEINYKPGVKRNISWLPQRADIDNDFPINVYEVVAMGCWPKCSTVRGLTPNDLDRVKQAIELVGLTDFSAATIGTLSGGQFQRMLFARMLVQDAPVMLMDEPFVGIDEDTRRVLLELIVVLNKRGTTIVTVLHDIDIIRQYFPNLLLIDRQKALWGETNNVLAQEANIRNMKAQEPNYMRGQIHAYS